MRMSNSQDSLYTVTKLENTQKNNKQTNKKHFDHQTCLH